jgi:hypothetical protein
MEKQQVPQDDSPSYAGLKKLLYAVDEKGNYTGVQSTGWEAEAFATETALTELNRLRHDAWQRAREGKTSALEFHMYNNRMELDTLSATTGLWRWRIKRHFDPKRYASLSDSMITRYAEAMGVKSNVLRGLPEKID